ncbi:MAG: TonB-dependent receptor [Alphaproteobacteria bacterium]|nr:MAG: TonB-dependent receptor [Alphaproteobacteria bacterium]
MRSETAMVWKKRLLGSAALLAAALPGAPVVLAQEGAAVLGAQLEEIVVRARMRSETLQTVPLSVSQMSGDFLDDNFVVQLEDVEKYTPNVELGKIQFAAGGLTASIRGASFADLEKTFEPAVAVAIDGMFFANNTGANTDFFDIASVEILRGPQGTLFGRNTIGGVINIERTRPTGEWGIKASASYGSFQRNDYKVVANAPVVKDVLALKLGFFSLNGDSHTRNINTGIRDDGIDKIAASGALLFTPSESFEALLTVDYLDDDSQYPGLVNLSAPGSLVCDAFGECFSNGAAVAEARKFKVSFSDKPFVATLESTAVNLRLNYKLDELTFESITTYMDMDDFLDEENTGGRDIGGLPILTALRGQKAEQLSQEIRVISSFDEWFNFVGGVFYFASKYFLDPQEVRVLGGLADRFTAGQHLDSLAAYAETYFQVLPKTRLTVGGRFTYEKKKFSIDELVLGFTCPDPSLTDPLLAACANPQESWTKFTPRVSIDHQFTDDVMAYFTWARGFRSGGFNGRAQTPTSIGPYDPETVDNFELGLRSEFWNRKARVNLTVFHTDYSNKQEEVITVSPVNPSVTETTVQNAASARMNGAEAEIAVVPTPHLTLRSAIGYLDGEYTKFLIGGVDVKDQRNFRYAPDWSVSVGGDYTIPIAATDGEVAINANYKWTDDFTTSPIADPTNLGRDTIPDYGEFDAAISYRGQFGSSSGTYKVTAFVKDAFHDSGRILRKLDAGVFWFGDQEPGRTWGVELLTEF